MAGCEDPKCQQQMREMYQDIYGHPGANNGMKTSVKNLCEAMPNKIEKKSITTIIAFIVLPVAIAITAAGLNVWATQYVYPYKFASQEAVADQERRVIVLEEGYKSISRQLDDLSDIKETNRKILQTLEELKQQRQPDESGPTARRSFYAP